MTRAPGLTLCHHLLNDVRPCVHFFAFLSDPSRPKTVGRCVRVTFWQTVVRVHWDSTCLNYNFTFCCSTDEWKGDLKNTCLLGSPLGPGRQKSTSLNDLAGTGGQGQFKPLSIFHLLSFLPSICWHESSCTSCGASLTELQHATAAVQQLHERSSKKAQQKVQWAKKSITARVFNEASRDNCSFSPSKGASFLWHTNSVT